jgi:hypothetical protein
MSWGIGTDGNLSEMQVFPQSSCIIPLLIGPDENSSE